MPTIISSSEGNSTNLTCIASARPAPIITWYYNSAAISATISSTTATTTVSTVTSVLKISSLTASANGQQVTCSASHSYSPTMNRTATLNIERKLVYYIVPIDCYAYRGVLLRNLGMCESIVKEKIKF